MKFKQPKIDSTFRNMRTNREIKKLSYLLEEERESHRQTHDVANRDILRLKNTIKELEVNVCSHEKTFRKIQKSMQITKMELEQSRLTVKKLRKFRDEDKKREKKMKTNMAHMKIETHKLTRKIKRHKAEAKRQALERVREMQGIIIALQYELNLRSVSDEECTLCCDNKCDVIIDPCGHPCCAVCLSSWRRASESSGARMCCPYCRVIVNN